MNRTRPFDPAVYPPIFDDAWFARVADCPQDLRCTTPTLTPQGELYERRIAWLASGGAHLLTGQELATVQAIRDGLELDAEPTKN